MAHSKRRSPRFHVDLALKWIVGPAARALQATTANAHGLFIHTHETVPPGSLMQIDLLLPDGPQRMIFVARFIGKSLEGEGIGVEIFVASPSARLAWSRYLHAVARNSRPLPEHSIALAG